MKPGTEAPSRHDGDSRGGGPMQCRWHGVVGHTADVGLRATAPDAEGLFEEAAAALAELSADTDSAEELRSEPVELSAEDPTALVYGWLNELIGLAEVRGEALARADVTEVGERGDGWTVVGRAWFTPFDGTCVRPRTQVKAVTFHRLHVAAGPEGWALEAYFDV